MRRPWRTLLRQIPAPGAVAIGGPLALVWACNAGPISDFPFADDSSGEVPSVSVPGHRDAGSRDDNSDFTPPPGADAGTSPGGGVIGVDPGNPGGFAPDAAVPGESTDASVADGGTDAAADAGDPWVLSTPWDGGWPSADAGPAVDPGRACPGSSGSDSACGGAYCGLELADLVSVSVLGRACTSDRGSMVAACRGSLPELTAVCAQSLVAQGRPVTELTIRQCAAGSAADGPCLGCFAAEMECALRSCSAAFLTGDGSAAAACRAQRCAAGFAACSGLPAVWME